MTCLTPIPASALNRRSRQFPIFGEGTARSLFGGKVNLQDCLQAFQTLVANVEQQRDQIEKLASRTVGLQQNPSASEAR